MKTNTVIPFLAIIAIAFNSCKIYDKMPGVSLGGFPEIKAVQADLQQNQLSLAFNLPVKFHNPFNKQIIIPTHTFHVYANGKNIPLQMQEVSSFSIPAASDYKHPYPFILNLADNGPLKEILGKDNELEFKIDMDVDLKQTGIKLPKILGKELLKTYHLSFSFKDSVRLPLMPKVLPSTQFAHINFTGEMETIDFTAIQNGLSPMVDIMLNSRFNNEYISNAANDFLNAKVRVYSPTWDKPFRTEEISLTDHIANLFGDDMKRKWNDLKAQLKPGNKNVMEYAVSTFLNPINNNAQTYYTNFKTQWSNFKQQPLVFQFPGKRVSGIQIVIPFLLKNPNSFAIELPSYTGEAKLGSQEPFSVEIKSTTASGTLAANQTATMDIIINLNWNQGNQGVMNLINGININPAFSGKLKVDLGYGAIPLNYNFPLQMKYGL